jgi:hypothetical protein
MIADCNSTRANYSPQVRITGLVLDFRDCDCHTTMAAQWLPKVHLGSSCGPRAPGPRQAYPQVATLRSEFSARKLTLSGQRRKYRTPTYEMSDVKSLAQREEFGVAT